MTDVETQTQSNAKTYTFNAEIKQLLDLMIHSLYSHKEIFLRELVSNASDALDKLKFQALTHHDLVSSDHQYQIRIEADADKRILKIIDSGIGMSKEEAIQFLGTIAQSGTKKFLELNNELKSRPELIGQFGVGFYSAFMVADKVTVHSQKAGTRDGILWESKGDGQFTLTKVPRAEGNGTTLILHLKTFAEDENVANFADQWVIKGLIKKYSDFISYPILMKIEDKDETLNSQKSLWARTPSEVTKEEHAEFYRHLTHDWNEPLKTIHYKAEGSMEFTALLYIPTKRPWNFFMKESEWGLDLYVKKVFIMNHSKDLLPSFLRFVRGLVESQDLSLNVSREILQQDRQVQQIRKNVINKTLGSLNDLLKNSRSDYEKFWNEFGATLKEGIPQEPQLKEKLVDLLLFHSTKRDGLVTLEDYVSQMRPDQKEIYFLSGDNLTSLKNSPYLERLTEQGFEVLLTTDPVDEWAMPAIGKFKDFAFVSALTKDLKNEVSEDEKKKAEAVATLVSDLKTDLQNEVADVVVSHRLSKTAAVLVHDATGTSARMEKILSQIHQGEAQHTKRTLEINPAHPMILKMKDLQQDRRQQWAQVLYQQALLLEGSELPDPVKYTDLVNQVILNQSN